MLFAIAGRKKGEINLNAPLIDWWCRSTPFAAALARTLPFLWVCPQIQEPRIQDPHMQEAATLLVSLSWLGTGLRGSLRGGAYEVERHHSQNSASILE